MQFTELRLDERISRALAEAGIETCTRVQEETLVHSLQGRDIEAQSQTGTGKTIAFLVTAFQRSLRDQGVSTRTLVVAPTRELAVQIQAEAEIVGRYLPHHVGSFYGGVGYGEQERLLREGVDVVIGTPGRLLDYGSSGKLDFRTFGIMVIDEADRLFDMGFIPDLRRIFRASVGPTERQTMLFSATLGERVKQLAWEHMNDPVSIAIEPDTVTVREVTQVLYHVGKEDKLRLLLGVLQRENPQRTLVFTNTKHAAETIARRLEINGRPCRYIMGDLPQSKRLSLIADMKAGSIPLLVATDVAARGLHIDDVDLVVNYDLPEDRESYVHRIGRTARAGKSGKAVSLVCERFVYSLEAIEAFINMKIPVAQVSDDLLPADASAGMSFGRPLRSVSRGGRPRSGAPTRARGGSARGGGGGRSGARREGERRADSRGERPAGARGQGSRAPRRDDSRGQGAPRQEGRPRPTQKRVSRDTPFEERAAHYRQKHDRDESPVPETSSPQGGRGGGSGKRSTGERRPEQRSSQRPQRKPEQPPQQRPRQRQPREGASQPRPAPTPAPAAPPARQSLLDKVRGLFKRKLRDGGKQQGA